MAIRKKWCKPIAITVILVLSCILGYALYNRNVSKKVDTIVHNINRELTKRNISEKEYAQQLEAFITEYIPLLIDDIDKLCSVNDIEQRLPDSFPSELKMIISNVIKKVCAKRGRYISTNSNKE